MIENSYRIGITNMVQEERTFKLSLEAPEGLQLRGAEPYTLGAGETQQFSFRVVADPEKLPQVPAIDIRLYIESESDPSLKNSRESRFILRSAR
jgi:hypothetical protein